MKKHKIIISGLLGFCMLAIGCVRNNVQSDYWPKHFPKEKYVRLGVIDTRYDITGQGPPLLLLHGFGYGYDMFDENVSELSKHFTVYRFDLRGMGYSSKPDGIAYNVQTQVQHTLDFMRHFKLEKVSVWGHSMGAVIAISLAVYNPERIDRLIISDAPAYTRSFPSPIVRMFASSYGKIHEWFPMRAGTRATLWDVYENDARFVTDERIDKVHRILNLPGGAAAMRSYLRSINFEEAAVFDGLLPDIQKPTLIIWGEKDKWYPVSIGERMQKAIPNSTLVVVEGAGHMVLEEKPDQVNRQIERFLMPEANLIGSLSPQR